MSANPALTKTGKTKLRPLNLAQLKELLEKSSKPKDKAKIQNRIKILENQLHVGKVRVVETFK
jgi:hypothetical protein